MFKIKISLVFLFISLLSNAQSLSGVYQVGSASPSPFNTLPAAVEHLKIHGVSGAVVFLLNDTTYTLTSPLVITPIAGSSEENTITIKPNVGKNVLIKTEQINTWTSIPAVIQISGAEHIIIDGSNTINGNSHNLTLQNNHHSHTQYAKQSVLWLASIASNGVSNFEIKNTNLSFLTRSPVWATQIGIFAGSNAQVENSVLAAGMATAVHSNISIKNNNFQNVREAITVKGNNTPAIRSEKFTITGNQINSVSATTHANSGFRISNVDGCTISNNLISGLASRENEYSDAAIRIENSINYIITNNTIKNVSALFEQAYVYGMYISGVTSNGQISENSISNLKAMKGFSMAILVDIDSSIASNTAITNNMISDVTTDGAWSNHASGIEIKSGKNIKIYHNTVLLSGASLPHDSHAIRINHGSQFDIRNNMFVNRNTLGNRYSIYSNVPATAFTQLNNNNYFSSQHIGFINGNQSTLANWKTITGKDANSINIQPEFISNTNLRLTAANVSLDNKGTFLAVVPRDIDGQLRNTTTPDVGAAEFGVINCATTTWNGTSWSNGFPDRNLKAVFSANYTATTNLDACSVSVIGNAIVAIPSHFTLNSGDIQVDATAKLILESDADLLQSATAVNSGQITVKRKTSALMRLDYILWSSPVTNQNLGTFSPQTSANRFYTYTSETDTYSVVSAPATTPFAAAIGYLVRTPNNHPATPTVWEGTFVGTANNGNIQVTVPTNKYTAVGNPYPSAISADQFIAANNLNSPIYLWRKTNGASTSSYATYTLAGGTATGMSGRLAANAEPMVPNGIITVGQGFIVRSITPQVKFDNSMRIATGSGELLRSAAIERNRLWLNLTGANDTFSQTLISYMTGATNDVDASIDGLFFNDSPTALTTIISSEEYAIQGRQLPFDATDIVALGFKTSSAGTFEISIDTMDGLFADDQQVYLVDNQTGITHDLKSGSYNFTTEVGVFNQRFEIKFELMSLGTHPSVIAVDGIKIKAGNQAVSLMADGVMISEVMVYDITGRILSAVYNVNESVLTLPVDAVKQIVIVRAITADGLVTTKKLML